MEGPTKSDDELKSLWDKGRLWEIFGFDNNLFTVIELTRRYSQLLSGQNQDKGSQQILEDAFSVLSATTTRRTYDSCRKARGRIKRAIGAKAYQKREASIWNELWNLTSECRQELSEQQVTELVEKHKRGDSSHLLRRDKREERPKTK
jgi:hypothetical protein